MAKIMLITGASKGIGAAFVKEFKDEYELVTVARSGDMTENGDVTDMNFRNYLIEKYTPNVFINNVGGYTDNLETSYELNLIQAGALMEGFYKKMVTGHIFNMSSYGALLAGYAGMGLSRTYYYASKKALNDWARYMIANKEKPVKFTNLMPSIVDTNISPVEGGFNLTIQKNILGSTFTPLRADYIPKVVRWILEQPKEVVIEEMVIGLRSRFGVDT